MSGGTIFPSEYCPGGHVKGGTSHTVTTSHIVGFCISINLFNLKIMGNVLGIIGTFLENYQGFFENLRIVL